MKGMALEKGLLIGAAIAFLAVIFFSKFKVCQNSQSGDLTSRPWLFPCPSGSYEETSASTQ